MARFIERFFGSIEWLIVAVFLLVLPTIYSTQLLDPVLYSGFLALTILILVLTVLFTIRLFTNKSTWQLTKIDKIIFGAALMYILSNVISSFGVVNTKEAIFHLAKETTYLLLFFYLYQLLRASNKGWDVLIKSIIVMAAIYLAIGYVQLWRSDFSHFKAATGDYGYYFRQAIEHVISTLMNVVLFSSFLFMSLPFSIYGVITYKKVWRIISGLVLVSALFFIFILASKGIWGATVLAFVVIGLLGYYYLFFLRPKQTGKLLPKNLKVALLVAPLLILLSGYLFIMKSDVKLAKMVSDKVSQVVENQTTFQQDNGAPMPTSTQTRIYAWENTIKLFKEHPVFGIGGGQWWIEYPKYGLDKFESDIRNGVMLFQRPHNDFLWILSENGIVGFFFYMIIYIGILVIAFRNFLKQSEWPLRIFAALAFAFLIGFMVDMFVSFPRERVTHNVMLACYFSLVLVLVPETEKKDKQSRSVFKYLIALSFLVIASLNVIAAKQFYSGEKAARAVKYGMKIKNYNLVYRAAHSTDNTIYTLDNFTTPMAYYKGVAQSSLNNVAGAKESFLEAYRINPYHLSVLNNLATCCDLTGDKKTALQYYQKALDISPRYKEALINKAIVHYNLNEFDKSMECILQISVSEKNPEKFENTMLTICKRKAILLATKCDEVKFKKWISEPNNIKATFVKVQMTKGNFDVILLQELAK
jgi:O-antigen ligase